MNTPTTVGPLQGCRIGILGKGGAGKSTVTVLLAKVLRQSGYAVCVLDADSANLGMEIAIGVDERPAAMVDYFGGMVFTGGLVTCPVDDPAPLPNAVIDLARLPARFYRKTAEGIVFMTVGKLPDYGIAPGCDGPMTKVARDLRLIDSTPGGTPPVLLVDGKAGYEDSARGLITSMDVAVVVVDPTISGIAMAATIQRLAEGIHSGALPATRHLPDEAAAEQARSYFRHASLKRTFVLLNKVGDGGTEHLLRNRLAAQRLSPAAVLRDDATIRSAWLRGEPLAMHSAPSLLALATAMEHALAPVRLTAGFTSAQEVGRR